MFSFVLVICTLQWIFVDLYPCFPFKSLSQINWKFDLYPVLFWFSWSVQVLLSYEESQGTDHLICTPCYVIFLDLYLLWRGTDQELRDKPGYRSRDLYPRLTLKTWSKIIHFSDWSVQLILDQAFKEKRGYRSNMFDLYPSFQIIKQIERWKLKVLTLKSWNWKKKVGQRRAERAADSSRYQQIAAHSSK